MSAHKLLKVDRKALMSGLGVQFRCVRALIIREMMMRYGRNNLGFLWVFVEPMILCVGVMTMWSLIRSPYENGIPIIGFVYTGYMPLTLWRHICNSGTHIFLRNSNLLYHRHVTLLDVLFTGMALEFAGTTAAFLIVGTTLIAAGLVEPPHDVGIIVAGWMLMGLLSSGVGCCLATLTDRFEVADKFIGPFQYLTIPLCGFMFMVAWLPTSIQHLVWYVPTVHCYEMIRSGFFGQTTETYYSFWYPAAWGIGLMAIGISFPDRVRDYIYS